MKKLGALAVIPKPFDPQELGNQIKHILKTAGKLYPG
jgi:DNA-binding response OmpR family regulator